MRAVIQRVQYARVLVAGELIGEAAAGLLVLLGVTHGDTERDADYLVDKIAGLRIFNDEAGKMNLSLKDTGGDLMVVSQFTLYADVSRGRRPGFERAAPPEQARRLYEYFVAKARAVVPRVSTGVFQAHMNVELVNHGPVTIIVDSNISSTPPKP